MFLMQHIYCPTRSTLDSLHLLPGQTDCISLECPAETFLQHSIMLNIHSFASIQRYHQKTIPIISRLGISDHLMMATFLLCLLAKSSNPLDLPSQFTQQMWISLQSPHTCAESCGINSRDCCFLAQHSPNCYGTQVSHLNSHQTRVKDSIVYRNFNKLKCIVFLYCMSRACITIYINIFAVQ